jgi:hypothetical protein
MMDVMSVEIVFKEERPSIVELYLINSDKERIEGGAFELEEFMIHVLDFYHAHL